MVFLELGVGENLTLDYKREISTEDSKGRDKSAAELCKDVSALANSAGGTIVYGVDEKKPERVPALPPCGTPRLVGRQPVEEWAGQVLATGVQPPMDYEIRTWPIEDGSRCLMAIRTGPSPFAPHMVTSRDDKRYYGRFYRRGDYESRIADEYEVREMLERARRLYEGVEAEIISRGYGDVNLSSFADNDYARRLVSNPDGIPQAGSKPGARRVSVLLLPVGPRSTGGHTPDRKQWISWLNPNELRYEPVRNEVFVPSDSQRPILGGISCLRYHRDRGDKRVPGGLTEYLLAGFDGSVELGFSSACFKANDDPWVWYDGCHMLYRTWQTVCFAREVRNELGLASVPYLLLLNIKNAAGGVLTGYDPKWIQADPRRGMWGYNEDTPQCLQTNLQIRLEFHPEDFETMQYGTRDNPPPSMRVLGDEISSAFGIAEPVLISPEHHTEGGSRQEAGPR